MSVAAQSLLRWFVYSCAVSLSCKRLFTAARRAAEATSTKAGGADGGVTRGASPSRVGQATRSLHEQLGAFSNSWQNNEIAQKDRQQRQHEMKALENRWQKPVPARPLQDADDVSGSGAKPTQHTRAQLTTDAANDKAEVTAAATVRRCCARSSEASVWRLFH